MLQLSSVRVRSDALIVFNPKHDADDPAASSTRGIFSKVVSSLKKDHSLFTWADKGQWETVNATDEDIKREATWFQIGFEPLFADFTKAGSWFIVYTLVEASETQARLLLYALVASIFLTTLVRLRLPHAVAGW